MIDKNVKGLCATSLNAMTDLNDVVRRVTATVLHGTDGLVDVSGITAEELNKSTKLVSSITKHEVIRQLRGMS